MKTTPCHKCADRTPDCHGSCKRYAFWSKENAKENEAKRKDSFRFYNKEDQWYREIVVEHNSRTGRTGRRKLT